MNSIVSDPICFAIATKSSAYNGLSFPFAFGM